METWQSCVEANMGLARRWASVALVGLAAACLFGISPGLVRAEEEVLDWKVNGAIEAGGMYRFGNTGSAKFNEYRDMDNGFLGELELKAEKKDSPYYFEIGVKNPARDDQMYEGALGRYGMFRLDLEWNQTPHVISNSAQTIYQQSGDKFTLPATQRDAIATIFTTAPTTPAGRAAISGTIQGLLRSVDLGFNTDVARAGFRYTPLEDLRFDLEYANIHREGKRPLGAQMTGSTSGPINELAIPVDNWTNEVKVGVEYAKANWGVQFGYTGSFFSNNYSGYTWENPIQATNTAGANGSDRLSAAPDNSANTFNLTGTVALPLRTRLNATFAYTMLRQNQTFEYNTGNPALAGRTNTDDAGNSSADGQVNLALANIVLTSRPFNSLTATARYRYFDYANDTPIHTFTTVYTGGGTTPVPAQSLNERYTKQNAGIDLTWRPISMLALKGGYEYEHWTRKDVGDLGDTGPTDARFSNTENIAKLSADVTPVDWFLGRVTYTYGDRTISGYNLEVGAELPQSIKYSYAPRIRNKVDALFQFSPWETFTPSFSVAYAVDDFHDNQFGLTKDDYFSAGVNLDWAPLKWLTFSTDFTYEQYNYDMKSRYLVGGVFPGGSFNDWATKTKDEFYNVGVSATVDIIPKRFDIVLGYVVNFGYTTMNNSNPNLTAATSNPQAIAWQWDNINNILQTAKIVARYRLTERLSLRGGFAYERYTQKDWARDPMQPFMGNYDSTSPNGPPITQGVQSVYLGATRPNYEAYIFGAFVRYAF
jgi:MtrB/PioB family decaheme-associated outer membrane protein